MKYTFLIVLFVSGMTMISGCSLLNTLSSVQKIEFALSSVDDVKLGGIALKGKSKVTDLSVGETISIANKVADKNLPLTMKVNLLAKNPNKESESIAGEKAGMATIQNIEWRMIIDDVPTLTGNVQGPISLPGNGQTITIPIDISMNLFDFFENRGYEGMAKLVFALSGVKSNSVSVKLDAKPTITTIFGQMDYPGRITIIQKKFD